MSKGFTPTVLTIAGMDPYGGAGVQLDSKTIHALGGYAFSVPTALTAQNSTGVKAVSPTPIDIFRQQLEAILSDVRVDAVKIGMLANQEIILVVAALLKKYHVKNIVLDTVLVSSSGKVLLESDAIEVMVELLFPLARLITPNIPEVNRLLNCSFKGERDEVERMASGLFTLGANASLLKGGHGSNQAYAIDYLVSESMRVDTYTTPRVQTTHTHGTGCLLSSAIAMHLAQGKSLVRSVEEAKAFLYHSLKAASKLRFFYHNEAQDRREAIL